MSENTKRTGEIHVEITGTQFAIGNTTVAAVIAHALADYFNGHGPVVEVLCMDQDIQGALDNYPERLEGTAARLEKVVIIDNNGRQVYDQTPVRVNPRRTRVLIELDENDPNPSATIQELMKKFSLTRV